MALKIAESQGEKNSKETEYKGAEPRGKTLGKRGFKGKQIQTKQKLSEQNRQRITMNTGDNLAKHG